MNDTKRQVFPAGLWIVATPIGNLGDLTPRAKWALEEARWILCEDTRRTAQLLTSLGILNGKGRLCRFDAHVTEDKVHSWVEKLLEGESLALVTDAGTPAVSDPGSALVEAAHQAGVRITPVPGVSAVSTLLSVAGFMDASFTFGGFFPRKSVDQKSLLKEASHSKLSRVFVWFESPQRIQASLKIIQEHCPEIRVVVGKELTKLHEHLFYGTSTEVFTQVETEISENGKIGEWCFVVNFLNKNSMSNIEENGESQEDSAWYKALSCLVIAKVTPSEAVKIVCQTFGIQKNRVYDASLRLSGRISEKIILRG